jgi:hypothetical protein
MKVGLKVAVWVENISIDEGDSFQVFGTVCVLVLEDLGKGRAQRSKRRVGEAFNCGE